MFKREKNIGVTYESSQRSQVSTAIIPGYFYTLKSSSCLDGYLICRVLTCLEGEFQAQIFKKSSSPSTDPDYLTFEETIFSYVLSQEAVISQLVSARCVGKILYANSVEIEEVLVSSLMNA